MGFRIPNVVGFAKAVGLIGGYFTGKAIVAVTNAAYAAVAERGAILNAAVDTYMTVGGHLTGGEAPTLAYFVHRFGRK